MSKKLVYRLVTIILVAVIVFCSVLSISAFLDKTSVEADEKADSIESVLRRINDKLPGLNVQEDVTDTKSRGIATCYTVSMKYFEQPNNAWLEVSQTYPVKKGTGWYGRDYQWRTVLRRYSTAWWNEQGNLFNDENVKLLWEHLGFRYPLRKCRGYMPRTYDW